MNTLLSYFINMFRAYDNGLVGNYPDPADPAGLETALTQDEINFVKKLKKEIEERFAEPVSGCAEEHSGLSITHVDPSYFRAAWVAAAGSIATSVTYRKAGDADWKAPNASGNATGYYESGTSFIFNSGFIEGDTYEIRVRNTCPNSEISEGVIASAMVAAST